MDLTISGRLDAFRTQHLAGPFYYRQLLPALERVFDELSSEDEVISIDKLELDLGCIAAPDIETTISNAEWENLLREQVIDALREQRKSVNPQGRSRSANTCRNWLFYVERGYMNWNAAVVDDKARALILETLATDYSMALDLRRLIQKSNDAPLRIVRDNSEHFLISLVEILTATAQNDLQNAIREIEILFKKLNETATNASFNAKQLQQNIWLRILQVVAEARTGFQTSMLVKTILLSEKNLPPITNERLKELTELKTIYPVLKVVQLKQQVRDKQKRYEPETGKKTTEQKLQEQKVSEFSEIDSEGIYVPNAGIVLLHPFISTFLSRLKLVANGKFHNAAAAEKAVHLLHYLATGSTAGEEHELVIPKFLCALPLNYALKEIIELTGEEKQEADNLLEAAIEKWEKLRNVSPQALRENFLQRPGKLYTKNDTQYLQLEGSSLDVLLDYLPWTLSILKLPWMKALIRIEWR
jgi:hypothetical protein